MFYLKPLFNLIIHASQKTKQVKGNWFTGNLEMMAALSFASTLHRFNV